VLLKAQHGILLPLALPVSSIVRKETGAGVVTDDRPSIRDLD
jgi:hypothetical protein